MNGTIVLPTLNRPHLLKNFLASYTEMKSTMPGLALVDKTDPQKDAYLALELPPKWEIVLTDAILMADKIHEVWERIKDLDYVTILNDDHVCQTEEWDKKVLAQINGHNVVFTNDNWVFPNRICGAICFSGQILRTLGYMFPKDIKHLFSDDAWAFLFSRAQCAQGLPDVVVAHAHAYKDKSLQDETFFKINGRSGLGPNGQGDGGLWPTDKAAFEKWMREDAEKDAQKLIAIQPKQGLQIATPSQDGNCTMLYALGLADLASFLTINNIYFEMSRVTGSSLLPHARNSLVDMFLKSKCKKLLFVDSDQGWDKESAMRLFQSDKRIIAGVIPHKRFPINLNFEPLEEDAHFFQSLSNKSQEEYFNFIKAKADVNGDVEVKHAGTGFMMIDRSVFEEIAPIVPEYQAFDDNPNVMHKEFFAMGALEKRYRGEDWWFTLLAKKVNIPIYINAYATCTHQGTHVWGVDRPQFPLGQPKELTRAIA